ncbi:uncharacterized protein LOC135928731 [Gordionus sp. m RMFG-2023]|uniref:uncharacterized protein LOC135928731 n=1 Tax=Gordionus sp. m RMFG-2023 TaxID=3053472 RepID=UPI0031FDE048
MNKIYHLKFLNQLGRRISLRTGVKNESLTLKQKVQFEILKGNYKFILDGILCIKNTKLKENYIKSNYENDFDLKIFCLGARQAFLLISKYLSQNKYDELKPYVSQKCIVELKQKNTNFDQEIIKELACNEENIYLSYPYKVMYKEDQNVLNCDINVIFCIMKLIYENKTPVKNMFGQLNLSFNRKFKLNQVTEWIISDIEIKKLAYF